MDAVGLHMYLPLAARDQLVHALLPSCLHADSASLPSSRGLSVRRFPTLDSWGYGSEELLDIQDQLSRLAHGYDEEE